MLYGSDDLHQALSDISKQVEILACTAAERGAYVSFEGVTDLIPTKEKKLVDSTGAGDLFAAGFLYGLCHKREKSICARMGNIAAGEVITHIGPRPERNLLDLFKLEGLA